jgi:predicted HicB family RNase H-like nuclease
MKQRESAKPLNVRIGGRLADELARIAAREQNGVSAVARRLITESLERTRVHQEHNHAA